MYYYPSKQTMSSHNKFAENKHKLVQIHWTGRFGNRMFQYAFGAFYAYRYGVIYYLPSQWEGNILFKPVQGVQIIRDNQLRLEINQTHPDLDNLSYRKHAVERYNHRTGDSLTFVSFDQPNNYGRINVCFDDLHMMYFPWIFKSYSVAKIKSFFQFQAYIVNLPVYQYWYNKRGTYDVAHIRRGDIVKKGYTGAHSAISLDSYHRAIKRVGVDLDKIIWVSDDPTIRTPSGWDKYCKYGWEYPIGQERISDVVFDFLPDFLTMVFARNLFRGNSSLSWWAAFLSEGNVYSPVLKNHITCNETNFMECDFVEGNYPHFMGNRDEGDFHDIIFGHP
jgi:hypothetical protein